MAEGFAYPHTGSENLTPRAETVQIPVDEKPSWPRHRARPGDYPILSSSESACSRFSPAESPRRAHFSAAASSALRGWSPHASVNTAPRPAPSS